MNQQKRSQLLEELYSTDRMDEYVQLLTSDWSDYDWKIFAQSLDTPMYNEFTGEMEESYNKKYLTNN